MGSDYANDLAAHNRSNSDRSLDSSKPNRDYSADRTSRNNIEAAVSLAVESLEGLRNDGEMEKYDH